MAWRQWLRTVGGQWVWAVVAEVAGAARGEVRGKAGRLRQRLEKLGQQWCARQDVGAHLERVCGKVGTPSRESHTSSTAHSVPAVAAHHGHTVPPRTRSPTTAASCRCAQRTCCTRSSASKAMMSAKVTASPVNVLVDLLINTVRWVTKVCTSPPRANSLDSASVSMKRTQATARKLALNAVTSSATVSALVHCSGV